MPGRGWAGTGFALVRRTCSWCAASTKRGKTRPANSVSRRQILSLVLGGLGGHGALSLGDYHIVVGDQRKCCEETIGRDWTGGGGGERLLGAREYSALNVPITLFIQIRLSYKSAM